MIAILKVQTPRQHQRYHCQQWQSVTELFDFFATRASLNLFFKFFRFRHVLHVIVKPVGACDSDDDDDDEWLELFHTEGQWSEAEQIKKEKKTCLTLEDRVETSNLQIHSFSSSLQSCMWAWKTLHPRKRPSFVAKKKTQKWRLKRLRPLWPLHRTRCWLATSCDRHCRIPGQPISARWLWRRRYSNMPPPFTKWKTFPGAPHQQRSNDTKINLRGIANANQNDERFTRALRCGPSLGRSASAASRKRSRSDREV